MAGLSCGAASHICLFTSWPASHLTAALPLVADWCFFWKQASRLCVTSCGVHRANCVWLPAAVNFLLPTQAGKLEDPRLKDVKAAVAKPTAFCDSSVCPDPEPVPGFQQRSTWMAGQRAASASPPPSGLPTQVRAMTRFPA
jgi:hypothetical protein